MGEGNRRGRKAGLCIQGLGEGQHPGWYFVLGQESEMKHWRTATTYPAAFMPHPVPGQREGKRQHPGTHFWVSWASQALALPTAGTARDPRPTAQAGHPVADSCEGPRVT